MHLTRFTDYSLRVLIYLGLRADGLSTIRDISDAYGISRHHLMKVVSKLSRLGYVQTRPGPGGGIALAKPPAAINLARVVGDIEGELALVECEQQGGACVISSCCRLRRAVAQALKAFTDVLESHSLEDLLQPANPLRHRLRITPP